MTHQDLHFEMRGTVAVIRLARPAKRNALGDALILALRNLLETLPTEAKAAVLCGEGEHFCAGLDLSELQERDAGQGLHHSRMWHAALDRVQYGPVPVIAALHGAVVGGGIHLGLKFDGRIAEDFKLATGTFVSVGPLRAKIIAAGAPYVQDVVLTGINLKEVGALVFPTPAVRALAGRAADAPLRAALASESVAKHFQKVFNELTATATGSANRIARLHLMHGRHRSTRAPSTRSTAAPLRWATRWPRPACA